MGPRALRPVAIVAALAILAGACVATAPPEPTPTTTRVKIVSSLPLQGPDRVGAITIVNGIRMALEEQGGRAGSTTVDYESWDEASPATKGWDPGVAASNARKAAADPSVVAYIGTYNSGSAAIAIPILCAAGLAMISPANTYPGLTKPGTGQPDEPARYYPGGCARNYTRVLAADDIQGAAAARWAKDLGAKSVYVLSDDGPYGEVQARVFRAEAQRLGLRELGHEVARPAREFRALAERIAAAGPDVVFYCGIPGSGPGFLLRDVRAARPAVTFIGCEGIAFHEVLRQAGEAAVGALLTKGYLPVRHYAGAQRDWAERYRARYGDVPEHYAIYGYEAAKVVLAAVAGAGARADDRGTVRDLIARTRDLPGALGPWSFDANGDTSHVMIAGLRVTKVAADFETSVEFEKVLH